MTMREMANDILANALPPSSLRKPATCEQQHRMTADERRAIVAVLDSAVQALQFDQTRTALDDIARARQMVVATETTVDDAGDEMAAMERPDRFEPQ